MGKGLNFLIGAAGGGIFGLMAVQNPTWVAQHPGTILAALATIVIATCMYVQMRMNRVVAAHEGREEAFRLAMLAIYAPELLDTQPELAIAAN